MTDDISPTIDNSEKSKATISLADCIIPTVSEEVNYQSENPNCWCYNHEPAIDKSSETITPGGSINLWVDSEGACTPYSWSVSGNGYSLSKATTNADNEITVLTSAGGT